MTDAMVLWWNAWIHPTIPYIALSFAVLLFVDAHVTARVNAAKPYVHPIRAGWSTDTSADVADFTVQNDRSDIVEIPDPGGDGYYLVLWRADVDGGDFEFIDPRNQSLNQRKSFTTASPLTIDGIAGQAVRSRYRLKRAEGTRAINVDEPPGWRPRRR